MKKPKKAWKPIPVAVQVKRHAKAVVAARKAAAHPSKAAAAKRSAAAKKAAATRAKHRKWSPDEDVALCSARAVAESMRLTLGVPVSDAAVLDLYWSVASDADAGISILDALTAAQELAGVGAWRRLVLKPQSWLRPSRPCPATAWDWPDFARTFRDHALVPGCGLPPARHDILILGVDWPQPHAVVAHDGFWWSWGEPYEPWTDQVSEAWAVTWA